MNRLNHFLFSLIIISTLFSINTFALSYQCNPHQVSYQCNPHQVSYQCNPHQVSYDCNCHSESYDCNCHSESYECNCHQVCYWGVCWTECDTCQRQVCDTCQRQECDTCYQTEYDTCYQTEYDNCYQTEYDTCYAPVAYNISVDVMKSNFVLINLSCSDSDSQSLTYSNVSNPKNGSLSNIINNQIVYSPFNFIIGGDSFNYKCNDGGSDSNIATVTIRILECQTDTECNYLDYDSCSGNSIIHYEGKCSYGYCTRQTTTIHQCGDGLFCNGIETCQNNQCVPGIPIDCNDRVSCTYDSCNEFSDSCDNAPANSLCDDGLYCNGNEQCNPNIGCIAGTAVSCTGNNIVGIATCNNNPDNNIFTWDYSAGFTSTCNEATNSCSTGSASLTHTCDEERCNAECDGNSDCAATECDNLDGCVGDNYYDYADVINSCLEDCGCTNNSCSQPTISYDDPRCISTCTTDDDCNNLDNDYCSTNKITHDEGKCVNSVCVINTTTVEDCDDKNDRIGCALLDWQCSEEINAVHCVLTDIEPKDNLCSDSCSGDILNRGRCNSTTYMCYYSNLDCNSYNSNYCEGTTIKQDDYTCENLVCAVDSTTIVQECSNGLYCDGQETCNNAQCVSGNAVSCFGNNIAGIATCNYNPDSNPFTFDFRSVFTSTCNEATDQCTIGSTTIAHSCNVSCGAECEADSNCEETDCDYLDGCIEDDYYDYHDVNNDCLADCSCEEGSCGMPTIYHDDARCVVECLADIDCDDGLYCNGQETCVNHFCVDGTTVSCSGNNIFPIATCNNNPDNNIFTWDYSAGFTSTCNEATNSCSTGSASLTHTCDEERCNAECDGNSDCAATECDNLDGCLGDNYYDYTDVNNNCLSCACESKSCSTPDIYYNDARCTECQVDSDCNHLDNSYCEGSFVRHNEGRCVNYECEIETSTVQNCVNSLFCDGQETCSNGHCVSGTAVVCSGNNIGLIATCNYNPDNNPFTWDYFNGFDSVCNEAIDSCTNGAVSLIHTCNKSCGAKCVIDSDCNDSLSYTEDICLAGCTCENEIVGLKIISTPVNPYSPQNENYCSEYRYDVNAVGPTYPIYYSLITAPAGMSINRYSGEIVWMPKQPGNYEVSIFATDGLLNDTQTFILNVIAPPKDTEPREKFLISKIRTNKLVYDEVKPGDLLFVDLVFENIGRRNTKEATIRITSAELGITKKLGPFEGPEAEEVMSKGLYVEIPKDAQPGVYSLRISLSDLNGIRRTRYRDFRVIE